MGVITHPNANSWHNYPLLQFRTVLENASLGKRGVRVFDKRTNINNPINSQNYIWTYKQKNYR